MSEQPVVHRREPPRGSWGGTPKDLTCCVILIFQPLTGAHSRSGPCGGQRYKEKAYCHGARSPAGQTGGKPLKWYGQLSLGAGGGVIL